ncbi:MAG TPA: imidazoleglycerol-phosphate dehydratase HisB [Firmicutes bacterium]|nr:imidazoleglycerol-phosphate dehydratase HisB [Bacillota bacterium]
MARKAEVTRKTLETDIEIALDLDGTGSSSVDTGVGFFNHMLTLFAKHGLFDISVRARGDLDVDAHHTVEDTGICLGKAFADALGGKQGIQRYGSVQVPMDEALASVVVDISGRPFLVFNAPPALSAGRTGDFDVELVEEFFRAFATNAGITLHINVLYGRNVHHMVEAIFKGAGRAMSMATRVSPGIQGVLSTKGLL